MFDTTRLAGSAGVLAGAGVIWIAGSYAAAPTIGERLVTKSGEIARCSAAVRAGATRATEAAIAAVPKPARVPSGGDMLRGFMGALVGHHPGADAYMAHYGPQFQRQGDNITDSLRQQLKPVEDQYESAVARLRQIGERNAKASGDVCTCRARAVINSPEGRSGLAWHIGSLGFVRDFPANDWQAAMRKPDVVAQCGAQA